MIPWKHFLGIFFLTISLIFGIASLASDNWVSDRNIVSPNFISLQYSLRHWTFTENPNGDLAGRVSSGSLSYYGSDRDLYYYRQFDLVDGSLDSWKSAGSAALAMGIIALIGIGFSLLAGILAITGHKITGRGKIVPLFTAAPAWLAGFCLFLGSLLYEGIRPGFHGNQGYEWPLGLYLTSGISADIGAFFYYWSEPKDFMKRETADFN